MDVLRASNVLVLERDQQPRPSSAGMGVLAALKKKLSFKRPMQDPTQYSSLPDDSMNDIPSSCTVTSFQQPGLPGGDDDYREVASTDGSDDVEMVDGGGGCPPSMPGHYDDGTGDSAMDSRSYVISEFRDVAVNNFFMDRPSTAKEAPRRLAPSQTIVRPASAHYASGGMSAGLAAGGPRPPAPLSSFVQSQDKIGTSSASSSRPASTSSARPKSGRRGPRSRRMIKSGLRSQ